MQRTRFLAALAAASLAVAGLAAAAFSLNAGADKRDHANGELKHVFVIMLENHSRASVIGDPAAPTITALADTYGVASQYYGVTHPSEPNYVAAISGSNWFVNDDNPANRFDHTNLIDQLQSAGKSWGAYMESMPTRGTSDNYPDAPPRRTRAALRLEAQPVRALRRHPQRPGPARERQAVHGARSTTSTTTRRTSSSSARTSATTCTAASARQRRRPTARPARSRTPPATRTTSR